MDKHSEINGKWEMSVSSNPVCTHFNKAMNQEKRPSLLINALSNWIALAITVVVGFLMTPYIISHLGKTSFGIWILVNSIIGYYGILDLGVTSAITRYVARYAGQRNYRAINETASTALALFCALGLALAGVSFALAGPLSSFFNVSGNNVEKFRQVVCLLGLAAGLGLPGNLLGAIIRAHERFVMANCVKIIVTLVQAGLIVLSLSRGMGLVGVAYSQLVSTLVMMILTFVVCKLLFSYFQPKLRLVSWHVLYTILGYGAATTVLAVANIMRFNLDSFVIGKWINLPAVGVYGVSVLLIRFFLRFISTGIQKVLTPRFAFMDGNGERGQLQQLFLNSLSTAAFLSFGVGTLIIVFGKQFIVLWLGTDFLDAVPVLWVLAAAYSLALAQTSGISLMFALKKHKLLAAITIVEGIANVALSIQLAPRYGILGVAIGTAVPMLVIKVFFQPIYVSRIIGISLRRYWCQLAPAFCLATGIVMSTRYVSFIALFHDRYLSLAVSVLACITVFSSAYLFVHIFARKGHLEKE